MMVLDDLFSDILDLHVIEPISKVVKIKRVVPKTKFDMAFSHLSDELNSSGYKKKRKEELFAFK